MIQITLKLLGHLKEKAGVKELTFDLPDGATVGDLKAQLIERYPQLRPQLNKVVTSVNRVILLDAEALPDQAEVIILPPVGGG
jgi:molybdopterin converting factor small subunit